MLLPTGSFSLLVGANGSGKTTLLRLASTYAQPTTGKIHWGRADGGETTDPSTARRRIGYAGHVPLLYDELTPREHLEFALRVRGAERPAARDATTASLDAFDLAARGDERAETLSRGLRQRVALAQALITRPEILLLDEPAANLDARSLEALVAALQATHRKATVLLATHDPDPFRPLADRVLSVENQKVQVWGEHA